MRILVVAPDLGFLSSGGIAAGGLQQFGRCFVRAVSSFKTVTKLGVYSLADGPETEIFVRDMIEVYSQRRLKLTVKGFGGNRIRLATSVIFANWTRQYDRVVYLLVNQSIIGLVPGHLPYTVWEIGEELFGRLSPWKYQALRRCGTLLSISKSTSVKVRLSNPGLAEAQVVHLCLEPPFLEIEGDEDLIAAEPYEPAERSCAVLIVGSMNKRTLYKGHRELILGWARVLETHPEAELWVVGDGDARRDLEALSQSRGNEISRRIHFFGALDGEELNNCYRTCRVFAMPSKGEGFGLVFVEAARFGVPGIGGREDSAQEVIVDNGTGLLVNQEPGEIADACIRLLSDVGMAQRLGEAARARYLENFRFCHFRDRVLQAMGLNH